MPASSLSFARRPTRRPRAAVAIAVVVIAALLVAFWIVARPADAALRLVFGAVERPLGPMSLLTTGVDGSDLRPAYADARSRAVGFLSPSADGRLLAFISYDPKDLQIPHLVQLIHGVGAEPRTLYEVPLPDAIGSLALSPDGSRLLLTTSEGHGGGPSHLWSLDVAGGRPSEIRPGQDLQAAEFAWSPDGTRVVLVSHKQLWGMSPDGSDLAVVFGTERVVDPRTPAWSSDGRSIAFTARPTAGARGELFTMTERRGPIQVSQTRGVEPDLTFLPRWSPDGTRILFEGTVDGSQMRVFLADAAGVVTRLDDGDEGAWDPRWAPDGSSIVFSAKLPEAESYQLVRMTGAGTARVPFGPVFRGPISSTEWIR